MRYFLEEMNRMNRMDRKKTAEVALDASLSRAFLVAGQVQDIEIRDMILESLQQASVHAATLKGLNP